MKKLASLLLSAIGAATCCAAHAEFIYLDTAANFAELIKRDKVIALFVYPPGQPCKNMLAVATKVAKNETDVTFVVIDIRAHGELKKQYRVGGLPTLVLFSNSTELSRVTGQRNTAALKDFMARGFLGKRTAFMKRPLAYTTNWIRSHFATHPVCENE